MFLYILKITSNSQAKEKLFSWYFKGWSLKRFNEVCVGFSVRINEILRPEIIGIVNERKKAGDHIYIVSASIENWVIPWAEKRGITVLATQIATDYNQRLTGKFKSKNCYGKEKVNRLSAALPDRKDYYLLAYGDSKGDREMIRFADEGYLINPNKN